MIGFCLSKKKMFQRNRYEKVQRKSKHTEGSFGYHSRLSKLSRLDNLPRFVMTTCVGSFEPQKANFVLKSCSLAETLHILQLSAHSGSTLLPLRH